MQDISNEEFFEALNLSENEYYDAESPNDYDETLSFRNDVNQMCNILKQPNTHKNENLCTSSGRKENKISRYGNWFKLNAKQSDEKNVEDLEKINRNNEKIDDEMKESAEVLDAILNEESLKQIYFGEKCISKAILSSNEDKGVESKINLWSFINSNPQNHTEEVTNNSDHYCRDEQKLSAIEKEVQELELEIEKMFNSRSIHNLKIEPAPSNEKYKSEEDRNGNFFRSIPNKRKISPLPCGITSTKAIPDINQISSIPEKTYISNHGGTDYGKCPYISESIPSSATESTLNQDSASEITQFEAESDELFTPIGTGSTKAIPVHSIEIIPKLLEKKKNNKTKKTDIVKNIMKSEEHYENCIYQAETDSFHKKHTKAKIPQEFKKVQSLIEGSESSKQMPRNVLKNFQSERSNSHKIPYVDHSGSHVNMKVTGKMRVSSRKLKGKDCKKMKPISLKRTNRAVNTRRIKKTDFSCQKIGALIDLTNFCSISLSLESTPSDVTKKELMKSLKDHFWLSECNKERALLQLVILCMTDNFQEISIKNEKFKLNCQNVCSTNSRPKNDKHSEETENNESFYRSDLVCQPLFIETINSRSHVNHLGLQLNNFSTKNIKQCKTKNNSRVEGNINKNESLTCPEE